MSISTVLSIVLGLIKLANIIFGYLHDNELIKQGEDQQIAKALAEMSRRLTVMKAEQERVSKLSDKEVLDELAKNHELRD